MAQSAVLPGRLGDSFHNIQEVPISVLQSTPKVGQITRQYTAWLLTVRDQRLRKVQTVMFTVSNKMFYKELEEGACKIVDVNMILLV